MKFSIFTGEKKSLYIAWASFRNVYVLDSASQTQKIVLETELNQLLEIGRHPNIIDLIGYGFIDGKLLSKHFATPYFIYLFLSLV